MDENNISNIPQESDKGINITALQQAMENNKAVMVLLGEFKSRKSELDELKKSLGLIYDEYINKPDDTKDFRNINSTSKKMHPSIARVILETKKLELEIIKEINNIIKQEADLRIKYKDMDTSDLKDLIQQTVKAILTNDTESSGDGDDDILDIYEMADNLPDEEDDKECNKKPNSDDIISF